MRYCLGPERWKTLPPDHVARMRISEDIRRCIVFLGWGPQDSREFFGTGFLLRYRTFSWLVTARHVAAKIKKDPFYVWGNFKTPLHFEKAVWTDHKDKSVDVAVAAFGPKGGKGSVSGLPQDALLTEEDNPFYDMGVGDFAYVMGLFHLLPGEKRFLPVVHTGHIALLPEDERIPVKLSDGRTIEVEGYLVQAPTLSGLSGAPVFVRRTMWLDPQQDGIAPAVGGNVKLLGLWIAAWNGRKKIHIGDDPDDRVSHGMGVVIPAEKIVETILRHMHKYGTKRSAASAE